MVQESPVARRAQTGDGAKTPPERSWPGSEGDRNRFSLGPSRFPRRTVRYVARDDGFPITEDTDRLLTEILAELRAMRAELNRR